ncbi:hypothetical protein VTN31DRAFT_368 [Thermomyces dupontii]|uniref:uncharacterized protein n=1 Tax=Talaromyces thermophilus TaxID=28565 RepID=UPI003743CA09
MVCGESGALGRLKIDCHRRQVIFMSHIFLMDRHLVPSMCRGFSCEHVPMNRIGQTIELQPTSRGQRRTVSLDHLEINMRHKWDIFITRTSLECCRVRIPIVGRRKFTL